MGLFIFPSDLIALFFLELDIYTIKYIYNIPLYIGEIMKDHTKEYRLTIATDKETFNAMKNLALETMTTTSQIGDSFIKSGLIEHTRVPETTKRYFMLDILTQKSAQIIQNMRNYDEFYEFKRNINEICMILAGKYGVSYEDGVAGSGLKDLVDIMHTTKTQEPALYKECLKIISKTLNKSQKAIVIDASY